MSYGLAPLRRNKRKKKNRSSWGLSNKLHKHRKKVFDA